MDLVGWSMIGMSFVEGLVRSFVSIADTTATSYGAKRGVNTSNRGLEREGMDADVHKTIVIQLASLGVCLKFLAGMVGGPTQTPDWDQISRGPAQGAGQVSYLEGQLRTIQSEIGDGSDSSVGTEVIKKAVEDTLKVCLLSLWLTS